MIDENVKDLAENKLGEIRHDATPTGFASASSSPGPIEDFGEFRPPEVIRGCADRILEEYGDAPVRSHILTLAHTEKRTREYLRQEHCDVLEALVG